MDSKQLKKWLAEQGCTFETKKSGSGHLIVRRGECKSELPMHGGNKELGKGARGGRPGGGYRLSDGRP